MKLESGMKMMKRTMERAMLAIAVLGFTVSADAAKTAVWNRGPTVDFQGDYAPAEFKAMIKAAKAGQRQVAATDSVDEATALSEEFRNIRNSLIGGPVMKDGARTEVKGAQTSEDLTRLLQQLEANFKAGAYTKNDSRMLAAQLLMLKPFRGFVARARKIFDTKAGKARVAQASAITALRAVSAGIDTYLPTEQWKAGFAFAVEPTYARQAKGCPEQWSANCDITDNDTLQSFVRFELLPQLSQLNVTLSALRFDTPVYWDNQLLYGSAKFTSSADRFVRLGEAERLAMLSGTQAAISGAYGMLAFDLTGWLESFDAVAGVYGFQSVFRPGATTARERFNAVRQFPNLFRFRREDPEAMNNLNKSYRALTASLQNAQASWVRLEGRAGDAELQKNLLDPRAAAPFTRMINAGFSNLSTILRMDNGENDTVTAVVSGEKVEVNLKAFFTNPPASLQDFMPNGFAEGPEWLGKKVDGATVYYRNYQRGNPISWKYDVYSKYFPGVSNEAGIRKTARVLSQAWGGFFLGLPLSGMMM